LSVYELDVTTSSGEKLISLLSAEFRWTLPTLGVEQSRKLAESFIDWAKHNGRPWFEADEPACTEEHHDLGDCEYEVSLYGWHEDGPDCLEYAENEGWHSPGQACDDWVEGEQPGMRGNPS
jgi:hypothetical protein